MTSRISVCKAHSWFQARSMQGRRAVSFDTQTLMHSPCGHLVWWGRPSSCDVMLCLCKHVPSCRRTPSQSLWELWDAGAVHKDLTAMQCKLLRMETLWTSSCIGGRLRQRHQPLRFLAASAGSLRAQKALPCCTPAAAQGRGQQRPLLARCSSSDRLCPGVCAKTPATWWGGVGWGRTTMTFHSTCCWPRTYLPSHSPLLPRHVMQSMCSPLHTRPNLLPTSLNVRHHACVPHHIASQCCRTVHGCHTPPTPCIGAQRRRRT